MLILSGHDNQSNAPLDSLNILSKIVDKLKVQLFLFALGFGILIILAGLGGLKEVYLWALLLVYLVAVIGYLRPKVSTILKEPSAKPLGIKLLGCKHYRKEHQSIIEMDFEINNPTIQTTSLSELKAWILDDTDRTEADLQVLWDYETLAKISEPYDLQKPPTFERLHLPHRLDANTTKRYVAFFIAQKVVITGKRAQCGLIIEHTHGELKCEGISEPSPLQKIAGGLALGREPNLKLKQGLSELQRTILASARDSYPEVNSTGEIARNAELDHQLVLEDSLILVGRGLLEITDEGAGMLLVRITGPGLEALRG